MSRVQVDSEFLEKFEKGLDPRYPEKSDIPAQVLGYGEMSTVLEIDSDQTRGQCFKRMPMFRTAAEVHSYENILRETLRFLLDEIGVSVPPTKTFWLEDDDNELFTIYIMQQKLPMDSIGNNLIKSLPEKDIEILITRVLEEMHKVFEYNHHHRASVEIGFDGQISNWAVKDYNPGQPLSKDIELLYFDISSPLIRKHGKEQLDSELFLRSAPSFLRWIIRLLFVDDVMNRYYDERKVVIDLLANFYKEQRADLIPSMIGLANNFFTAVNTNHRFETITLKEVKLYYKEDALIWRVYLAARKIDRFLHKVLRKRYPYILPTKIKR